mgnify:CR=1 FL=1
MGVEWSFSQVFVKNAMSACWVSNSSAISVAWLTADLQLSRMHFRGIGFILRSLDNCIGISCGGVLSGRGVVGDLEYL